MGTTNTTSVTKTTNAAIATQKLKSERVQDPAAVAARKRVVRPDDQGGAVSLTRKQLAERLKSERVQSRLRQMPEWQMQAGGKAIDRVRSFPDATSALLYLAFSAVLARKARLPLQALIQGNTLALALPGSSKNAGIVTEEVLDLAERLG